MYYLYIDESGDDGDYFDKNKQVIDGSSKFFTLAGIIVDDNERTRLNMIVNELVEKNFDSITLPRNFKLHYHPLRKNHKPYDQLTSDQRLTLTNDIFEIIRESDCTLLSATINMERHCDKYGKTL